MASAALVIMPDSTNNRLVGFNPFDGSVVNSNLFALQAGTPLSAISVGNEIWVSEQVGDRISRWSSTGTHLGNIGGAFAGGGLDNIRGMTAIGGTIYVSNSGSNNDAPGAAVIRINTTGTVLGSFQTSATSSSPFAILSFQGGMLVASFNADDDIHRYDIDGLSLGVFHNSSSLNGVQQMAITANGDILAAGFNSSNIDRLDPVTGTIISSFSASGARGVFQLENGNILWTNASGALVYDINTQLSTLVYSGGGRHLSLSAIPEPSTALLGAFGVCLTLRRRRNH